MLDFPLPQSLPPIVISKIFKMKLSTNLLISESEAATLLGQKDFQSCE
jgi:hypothetical protein